MCGIAGLRCNNCHGQCDQIFQLIIDAGEDVAHRGPQAWGISGSTGQETFYHRQEGRFGEGLTDEKLESLCAELHGDKLKLLGLHTLYSTRNKAGQKKQPKSIQPWVSDFHGEPFSMMYNGNVYDLSPLREKARQAGWVFKSDVSDTEVIVALVSTSQQTDFVEALKEVFPLLKGGFSLVFIYRDKMIAARDRCGIRPLCIGSNDHFSIVSSESCLFFPADAIFDWDVRPGEIVVISGRNEMRHIRWTKDTCCKFCIFEFIYFARPDSRLCRGRSAYYYRNKAGIALAKEAPVDVDLIVSIPSGGDIFADAYASELGLQLRPGLFKNRSGRIFLASRGCNRGRLQRMKLHPLEEVIWGKRICLVDDSLVRLNTLPHIVAMCSRAGATEVHVRIGSAPIVGSCFYGIDTPTMEELAAANYSVEEIREMSGADSLQYLSLDGMIKSTGLPRDHLCLACFDKNYPVAPPTEIG